MTLSDSFTSAIEPVYDRLLRPRLPRKVGVYNGIPARRPALFDFTDHLPNHKDTLLHGVRTTVERGDTVVLIGGGAGVASVAAARETGAGGECITFEASPMWAALARETLELNGVADWSRVEAAVVGPPIRVYGDELADATPPDQLPPHDVAVLDCEGAEAALLDQLGDGWAPPRLVVETHAEFGAPSNGIVASLEQAGYEIETSGAAVRDDPDSPDLILTAVQTTAAAPGQRAVADD